MSDLRSAWEYYDKTCISGCGVAHKCSRVVGIMKECLIVRVWSADILEGEPGPSFGFLSSFALDEPWLLQKEHQTKPEIQSHFWLIDYGAVAQPKSRASTRMQALLHSRISADWWAFCRWSSGSEISTKSKICERSSNILIHAHRSKPDSFAKSLPATSLAMICGLN